MSETKVFENEKQKKEIIISSLKQFKTSTGWLVIKKALEIDIIAAEARLHGEVPLKEDETIKEWQDRRADRVALMELPDKLINAIKSQFSSFDVNIRISPIHRY